MSQYVPIKLDKMRNLRIAIKAIKIIEEELNIPISKIDFENIGMKELNIMLYAGLIHEDKELTIEKVLDIMDEFGKITEISNAIGKAIEISFGTNNMESKEMGK